MFKDSTEKSVLHYIFGNVMSLSFVTRWGIGSCLEETVEETRKVEIGLTKHWRVPEERIPIFPLFTAF